MTSSIPTPVEPRRAVRLSLCVASSAVILFAALAGSTEAADHGGGGHSGGGHGGGAGHGGSGHFGGGGHRGGYHGGGYHGEYRGRGWGGGYYPGPAIGYGGPYYCTPPLVWEVLALGGQCY